MRHWSSIGNVQKQKGGEEITYYGFEDLLRQHSSSNADVSSNASASSNVEVEVEEEEEEDDLLPDVSSANIQQLAQAIKMPLNIQVKPIVKHHLFDRSRYNQQLSVLHHNPAKRPAVVSELRGDRRLVCSIHNSTSIGRKCEHIVAAHRYLYNSAPESGGLHGIGLTAEEQVNEQMDAEIEAAEKVEMGKTAQEEEAILERRKGRFSRFPISIPHVFAINKEEEEECERDAMKRIHFARLRKIARLNSVTPDPELQSAPINPAPINPAPPAPILDPTPSSSPFRELFTPITHNTRCENPKCAQHSEYRDGFTHVPAANYNNDQDYVLYGIVSAVRVMLYSTQCLGCGHIMDYDGGEEEIYNYNNKYLLEHSLLNDFTYLYTRSTMPFHGYVASRQLQYKNHRCQYNFVSRQFYIRVWISFQRLQKWGFKYSCPWCGDTPEDSIWDGVAVSVRASEAMDLRPPQYIYPDAPLMEPNRSAFTFFTNRKMAALLYRHIGPTYHNYKAENFKVLTPTELQTVTQLLTPIMPLVASALPALSHSDWRLFKPDICTDSIGHLKHLRALISALCTDMPITQLIRSPGHLLLRDLVNNPLLFLQDRYRRSLHVYSPMLYDVFNGYFLSSKLAAIPPLAMEVLKQCLDRLMEVQKECHLPNGASSNRLPELPKDDPRALHDGVNYRFRQTGCYYGAAPIRIRCRYGQLDENRAAPKSSSNGFDTGAGLDGAKEQKDVVSDAVDCQKFYSRFKMWSGGLMVGWCRHRVAIGFHMIPKMEGRNDVFSAIVTRWKKPPRTIVYDNACAQQKYDFLREPDFFKSTLHVIDELHSNNHTCPECFKIGYFKASGHPIYHCLNCSAGETGNAHLAHIKSSARYMNKETLMEFARLSLEVHNRQRIQLLHRKDMAQITEWDNMTAERLAHDPLTFPFLIQAAEEAALAKAKAASAVSWSNVMVARSIPTAAPAPTPTGTAVAPISTAAPTTTPTPTPTTATPAPTTPPLSSAPAPISASSAPTSSPARSAVVFSQRRLREATYNRLLDYIPPPILGLLTPDIDYDVKYSQELEEIRKRTFTKYLEMRKRRARRAAAERSTAPTVLFASAATPTPTPTTRTATSPAPAPALAAVVVSARNPFAVIRPPAGRAPVVPSPTPAPTPAVAAAPLAAVPTPTPATPMDHRLYGIMDGQFLCQPINEGQHKPLCWLRDDTMKAAMSYQLHTDKLASKSGKVILVDPQTMTNHVEKLYNGKIIAIGAAASVGATDLDHGYATTLSWMNGLRTEHPGARYLCCALNHIYCNYKAYRQDGSTKGEKHWTLLLVDFHSTSLNSNPPTPTIHHFESLSRKRPIYDGALVKGVGDFVGRVARIGQPASEWLHHTGVGKQTNGDDCGVHVLANFTKLLPLLAREATMEEIKNKLNQPQPNEIQSMRQHIKWLFDCCKLQYDIIEAAKQAKAAAAASNGATVIAAPISTATSATATAPMPTPTPMRDPPVSPSDELTPTAAAPMTTAAAAPSAPAQSSFRSTRSRTAAERESEQMRLILEQSARSEQEHQQRVDQRYRSFDALLRTAPIPLAVHRVKGQGDCAAICSALHLFRHSGYHYHIRHCVCDQLELGWDDAQYAYGAFVVGKTKEEYIRNMRQLGAHFDQLELRAAADCFKLNIQLYEIQRLTEMTDSSDYTNYVKPTNEITTTNNGSNPPLALCYDSKPNAEHFDLVVERHRIETIQSEIAMKESHPNVVQVGSAPIARIESCTYCQGPTSSPTTLPKPSSTLPTSDAPQNAPASNAGSSSSASSNPSSSASPNPSSNPSSNSNSGSHPAVVWTEADHARIARNNKARQALRRLAMGGNDRVDSTDSYSLRRSLRIRFPTSTSSTPQDESSSNNVSNAGSSSNSDSSSDSDTCCSGSNSGYPPPNRPPHVFKDPEDARMARRNAAREALRRLGMGGNARIDSTNSSSRSIRSTRVRLRSRFDRTTVETTVAQKRIRIRARTVREYETAVYLNEFLNEHDNTLLSEEAELRLHKLVHSYNTAVERGDSRFRAVVQQQIFSPYSKNQVQLPPSTAQLQS